MSHLDLTSHSCSLSDSNSGCMCTCVCGTIVKGVDLLHVYSIVGNLVYRVYVLEMTYRMFSTAPCGFIMQYQYTIQQLCIPNKAFIFSIRKSQNRPAQV